MRACPAPTLLLAALGLFPGAALGADGRPAGAHAWCGTGLVALEAQAAIHHDNRRRLAAERAAGKTLPAEAQAFAVGDVAVLVDDGSLVVAPNPLDLAAFGVQFVRQKKNTLVASPVNEPLVTDLGTRLALGDDDARLVPFPRGFKFRFYNKVYTKMFVHSDGNLTFGAADAASTDRNLDRLLGGPPRIAPLFSDLDPSVAEGEAGVYVLATKTRVVVTWLEVPAFGLPNDRSTFQVTLYPNGRITFVFGELRAPAAVVGVSPGGGAQALLVDYTNGLPSAPVKGAIAERFAAEESFDHLAISRLFFREFADVYDHLVVFLDFDQSLGPGAFAFEMTIKNEIRGIGEDVFDFTSQVGSRGQLRSFVQMGTLSRFPTDPAAVFLGGVESTLSVLAHETGHRWLALPDIVDESGQRSDALRGRQRSHWSFCFNSRASHVEGNEWREVGGDRFTSVAGSARFSDLDQYLMGLVPAGAVQSTFYVEPCADREAGPTPGSTIRGRRVPVGVEQILAAEGPREPAAAQAPHAFRIAFAVVGRAGQVPSPESVAKVDRFRGAYEGYFPVATTGNGTISTTLESRR